MENEVQVGQLIAGKYRVEQTIGRGGMGVVVAALHEQLNQRVALKFLTDNAYQQPEAVARFVREARAAVQIQSEHVARVMDVGTLDNGAPYMVMEYLRGRDLKEVSARRGPLPVSEAVDFVLQACDAVAEAHSLGIVHRDLKPSNLFLTERPDGSPMVKVLDFGISKALHPGERSSQLQMTASAAIMGSPQYMSPEQIRSSKNVDARADVWALGTILHELLTGSPAYVADTVPGLLAMIVADAPPPLTSARPDAPRELEATILRCLEKDRERRFASVAALARSLERFCSSEARPLVRRIARVLGEGAASETGVARLPPAGFTVNEAGGQTNGTWSRTGRLREGVRPPLYARLDVQIVAGLGVVGFGVLTWLLATGTGNLFAGDALLGGDTTASTVAPAPAAAAVVPAATNAPAVAPAALSPLTPRAAAAAESVNGGIRPIVEPLRSTATGFSPATVADARPANEQGPESTRQAATPSNRTARRLNSVLGRPPRQTSPSPKLSRPPRASSEPALPAASGASASPAKAPAKKAETHEDLFNDTK